MSVRKAQTDFFSPMTGNVFRDNRRRADLIMEAAKVDLIKTDDPFTQVRERKSYYSPDDSRAITDAFDRDYGVLSDQEAAQILEENRQIIEEPTPVINPEPIPTTVLAILNAPVSLSVGGIIIGAPYAAGMPSFSLALAFAA